MRRSVRGFTLIELLVVIAITAILVSLAVPGIRSARQAARGTKSAANLRSLGLLVAQYANDTKDSFPYPWKPNLSASDRAWATTLHRGPNSTIRFWFFNTKGIETEMFGPHMPSQLFRTMFADQLANDALFSPMDRYGLATYYAIREKYDLGDFLWPGTYWYPPTFWFTPLRYPESGPLAPAPELVTRTKTAEVAFPAQKVLLFERADFEQPARRQGQDNETRVPHNPSWNSPDARPRLLTVDGSVRREGKHRLHDALWPGTVPGQPVPELGDWRISNATLTYYSMETWNCENGQGGTSAWPAYYWATRDGVRGRDVP